MATMRRILDLNAGFRSEVAESASEDSLGRPAWLWLARPEGWSEELEGVTARTSEVIDAVKEGRAARMHLAAVEKRLAKAEKDVERLTRLNTDLVGEVDRLRQARAAADARAGRSEVARAAAEEEGRRAGELAAAARAEAEAHERRDRRQREEISCSTRRIAELESDLDRSSRRQAEAEARMLETEAGAARHRQESAKLRSELSATLARAAGAAAEVGPALQAALETLDAGSGPKSAAVSATRGRARRSPPRGPVALPPAIFEDSPEAVEFLLRAPGIHLIVDGYNVALTSWPGSDLPALRDRLVSALAELALRLRIPVMVVFDGVGEGGRVPPPPAARSLMTVLFSASHVEADEEIVLAADRIGSTQPVIVATDDRAVRDASRTRRANVITVAQLLVELQRRTPLR
jgi:predicted RNA-binding protein with PIN domain